MIALQERCGVDVVTDGEMRRTHFIAPLTDVISGRQADSRLHPRLAQAA